MISYYWFMVTTAQNRSALNDNAHEAVDPSHKVRHDNDNDAQ